MPSSAMRSTGAPTGLLEIAVVPVLGGLPALRRIRLCATSTSASTSIAGRLSPRTQNWIDVFGIVVFLLPMAHHDHDPVVARVHARPGHSSETVANAGGLILWPVRLLVPVGFFLLLRAAGLVSASRSTRLVAHLLAGRQDRRGIAETSSTIRSRRRHGRGRGEGHARERGERGGNDRVPDRQHGADDVRVARRVPAARLSRSPSRSQPTASSSA